MKYAHPQDQRGFGHLGLILVVVVVLAVGGAGWLVWNKQQSKNRYSAADSALQDAIKNAKCDYQDKDICKFFASWEAQDYSTMNVTTETDGTKTTIFMQSEGKDKSHYKVTGDQAYEIITIGNDTYTKATNGTWWKQTTKNETAEKYEDSAQVDLTEPTATDEGEANKTSYKLLGKEKCGNFTCFKYQIVAPGAPAANYMWFDDEDYLLRRIQNSADGYSYNASFDYEKVSINVPSPVKELGENQYLIPGQDQPTTLPSAGDGTPTPEELQQYLDQYGQ